MIKKIFANKSSFKTVEFRPGMNIVWADRTNDSTKKDSRNGLGKTTLIEIIHFCLGAKTSKGKGLLNTNLDGWEFSLGAWEIRKIKNWSVNRMTPVFHAHISSDRGQSWSFFGLPSPSDRYLIKKGKMPPFRGHFPPSFPEKGRGERPL
ncbi:hypothetical protein [Leptospirillum sp. Group II 'CF-1']|uniref:hypothetical protein n=1 Tax=Leptospirillum sp. Group II 'CF-1' TaxID=1660083 RepID=UPI0018CD947E|nr:hypothetical protein [Leptospirillum sp. Group II 'CF-1']